MLYAVEAAILQLWSFASQKLWLGAILNLLCVVATLYALAPARWYAAAMLYAVEAAILQLWLGAILKLLCVVVSLP